MIVDSPKAASMNDDLWLNEAACTQSGTDPMWWFPRYGNHALTVNNVAALKACYSCPVVADCRRRKPDFRESLMEQLQVIWAGKVLRFGRSPSSKMVCPGCSRVVAATTKTGLCLECAAGPNRWER